MWGAERITLGKLMYLKSLATITIDCVLSSVAPQYQADGCIYEMSGTDRRMRTPGSLKAGDLVKVRLWLPNDDTYIFIQLAEVRWVKNPWVGIEFITMDAREKARLVRYSEGQMHQRQVNPACEHILIRA